MNRAKTVTEYIDKNPLWQKELLLLRDIILTTELEETIKWGGPVYTLDGKNLIGLGSFKSYAGLWFFQGALLSDKKGVLLNAQDGITRALRQWRFRSIEEIDPEMVLAYISEAINNHKKGNEIKPEKKPAPEMPHEMMELIESDPALKSGFKSLTPFKQREFIEYITQAKREETKQKRILKIIPLIKEGIGLNDKYR